MSKYRIDNLEIDPEALEIRDLDGALIPLEPRAFRLLRYLIEHRDRVVPSDELLGQVWSDRVVSDGVIRQAVAKVRRVFEGDVIKTVPRVGYRFVGPAVSLPGPRQPPRLVAWVAAEGIAIADLGRQEAASPVQSAGMPVVELPSAASAVTLAQRVLADHPRSQVGLHVDEVQSVQERESWGTAAALAEIAAEGQMLLSGPAFELARIQDRSADTLNAGEWIAHGEYELQGLAQRVRVFEVGAPSDLGRAPKDSAIARRVSGVETILGWRAAVGLAVPDRPHWQLREVLGEGGFGEAWLGQHEKTHEKRVFKFCYRSDRLRSLQREVTLFRLLKETLGERDDIVRILDWNFERAPYFVESEYTEGSDLTRWLSDQGGAQAVPLSIRVALVQDLARALAVIHGVGVLHKDVKPANVLVRRDENDRPRAVLGDFGIGLITDPRALHDHDITALGITEITHGEVTSSRTGTRLYMAPELLEGQSPTHQADIYSLGVLLYQLIVGDLERVLAPGWERGIENEVLREDVAEMVAGDPERRIADMSEVAQRLANLDARCVAHRRERQQAERLARERRRRRVLVPVAALTTIFAIGTGYQTFRIDQQSDRANREAARATAVSEFLTEVFESADPYQLRGTDVTAKHLLDSGARSLAATNGLNDAARAELQLTMARAYLGLNDFSSARRMLGEAAGLVEEHTLDSLVPALLLARARMLRGEGKTDEARAVLEEAIAIAHQPSAIADVLDQRAALENEQLEHGKARELLQRALALREESAPADPARLLETRSRLAQTLSLLGKTERAIDALEGLIDDYGDNNPAAIEALERHALLLARTDELDRARQQAELAFELAQAHFPADHPVLADAADTLASVLLLFDEYAEAERLQRRAYDIRQAAFGDHPQTAESTMRLANLYMNTGDVEAAKRFFDETFRLNRRLYGEINYRTAASLVDYAMLLFDYPESHQEAVQALNRATTMFDETLGDRHWATGLAYVYLSRGHYLVEAFDLAAEAGERAVTVMDAAYPDGGYRHSLAYLQRAAAWFRQGRVAKARADFDAHFPILAEHRESDAEDYQIVLATYDEIRAASDTDSPE